LYFGVVFSTCQQQFVARQRAAADCLKQQAKALYSLTIHVNNNSLVSTSSHCSVCQADHQQTSVHSCKTKSASVFEVHQGVSSFLDLALFQRPPTLRHACRCVIRKAVKNSGRENLPTAVSKLPVPALLQRYLDLCKDDVAGQ
jgi:hypothetical protein